MIPKKPGKNRNPHANKRLTRRHRRIRFRFIGKQTTKTTNMLTAPPISRLMLEISLAGRENKDPSMEQMVVPAAIRRAQGREILNTCRRKPFEVTFVLCSRVRKKLGIPIAVAPIRLN